MKLSQDFTPIEILIFSAIAQLTWNALQHFK